VSRLGGAGGWRGGQNRRDSVCCPTLLSIGPGPRAGAGGAHRGRGVRGVGVRGAMPSDPRTGAASVSRETVVKRLLDASWETRELGGGRVSRIDAMDIEPSSFFREYVSPGIPVIIENAIRHW